ncbi:energy transducer TonB [Pacificimonas sp. WHA3]|uniref:Energy transducer TonB n=1 Tax=Pacificimonas pallii TaxID=2827236 RepID=A0ABS6SEF1_9SPHN|nr:energy transducer TonB [Pacificimonas pallii]MBV7256793.1 energy transducer TonB [Pacificimonas pallii]
MMRRTAQAAALAGAILLAAPISAQSLQDRFDTAQTAYEAENWADAAKLFGALLDDLSETQRGGAVGAAVLSRRGDALVNFGQRAQALGDLEEAARIFEGLPEGGGSEAAANSIALASIYEMNGNLPIAAATYAHAEEIDPSSTALSPAKMGEARSSIFHRPDRARALAEAAIAEVQGMEHTKENEELLTALFTLRGRIALNHEAPAVADDYYDKALALAGRRSRKIDIYDARLRAEASYPDFLRGRRYDALLVLESSGAGRMMEETPPAPDRLGLPQCAPLGIVRPEDSMILDLGIAEDGTIASVTPIYSSRPGAIEAEFISEMRKTAWNSANLKNVSRFFRASMRVQVSCTNKNDRQLRTMGDHAFSLVNSKFEEVGQFRHILYPGDDELDQSFRVRLRGALAKLEAADAVDSLSGLITLVELANVETDREAAQAFQARADALARSLGWSASERALLWAFPEHFEHFTMRDEYLARIADVEKSTDPLRAEALALLYIRAGREREFEDDKRTALSDYASVLKTGLPESSLSMQLANLRLASLSAELKRFEDAENYLTNSGLTPDQCSLVDLRPLVERKGISSGNYPDILIRLGMSGQVVSEFDIGSDGKAITPRITYSFPPFVFNKTVSAAARRMRFAPIYRQGTQIGCQDWRQRYKFESAD